MKIICFTFFRVHKYSILFYNFIEFITLLCTFLVTSFDPYKEFTICLISIGKFSDVLPTFTCARAIGTLRSILYELTFSDLFHILLCI